jgi:hypothetical protein
MIANTVSFTGSLPTLTFSASYAPVAAAARIAT